MYLAIHKSLLALALLLCCFISSIHVDCLGGLGKEASFYPIALGIVVWIIEVVRAEVRIYIPEDKSFYAMMLFFVVIVLSSVINIEDIVVLQFKGSVAFNRNIVQMGTVCLYILSSIYAYNIFRRMDEDSVSFFLKWLKCSFVIAGIYGIFELGKMFMLPFCKEILFFWDSLFRGDSLFYSRIRLVASESSFFGMYAGLIFPCFFYKIKIGDKLYRWRNAILISYILLLVWYSFSRTAYMIIGFELFVFALIFRRIIIRNIKVISLLVLIGVIAALGLLSRDVMPTYFDFGAVFSSLTSIEGSKYTMSNIGRIGSQLAALYMWLDHPWLGVGYGMYAFHAFDYFPDWGWKSPEVIVWGMNDPSTMWPPAHGLYARLLAESGLLGLASYVLIYVFLLHHIYRGMPESVRGCNKKVCAYILLCVFFLFGFNVDGLRYFPFWIFAAAIWNEQPSNV